MAYILADKTARETDLPGGAIVLPLGNVDHLAEQNLKGRQVVLVEDEPLQMIGAHRVYKL